ncbi:hypothetical protein JCM17380_55460 [Desulfosporosinus burensis]
METEISGHNNDIIMKATAAMFKDKTLEVFGLKTAKIVDIMSTVLPVVEAKEKRVDFVFLLEDDTLLHLEFQTTVPEDLLRRVAYYGARLVERHNMDVNTAVIYSGRIESASELLEKGSLCYRVTNVFLKGMDGDAEYYRIKTLLGQGLELEEVDLLKLILLPLMKSQQPEAEMTIKAAQLAKSANSKLTDFVIGSIIAITDKFLPEEYKKKLLEVLSMTQIEEWIREEGKAEGKVEGKAEGKLEAARNAVKKGLSLEDIAEITDLPLETVQKLKAELSN